MFSPLNIFKYSLYKIYRLNTILPNSQTFSNSFFQINGTVPCQFSILIKEIIISVCLFSIKSNILQIAQQSLNSCKMLKLSKLVVQCVWKHGMSALMVILSLDPDLLKSPRHTEDLSNCIGKHYVTLLWWDNSIIIKLPKINSDSNQLTHVGKMQHL